MGHGCVYVCVWGGGGGGRGGRGEGVLLLVNQSNRTVRKYD